MQTTNRDVKKLADKQRKQLEEAYRAKEAALREDENVFDVAYEAQGGEGGSDVLSATDIKVQRPKISLTAVPWRDLYWHSFKPFCHLPISSCT